MSHELCRWLFTSSNNSAERLDNDMLILRLEEKDMDHASSSSVRKIRELELGGKDVERAGIGSQAL